MSSSNGGVPPGFRFHPTDEELLHYYLKKKVSFQKFDMEVIREVDLNKMEPWELQERCRIGSTPQNEWYFFSHKDRKYPTGSRTNRATSAGFWKATGRDKCIRNTYKKIGMRKTLVFYRGRAPHGQKTDWIMHEYRLEDMDDAQENSNEDGWVVCRVFKKKNLFKIGNSNEGGSTTINVSDHSQQLNVIASNTSNHLRTSFVNHRDNQYLIQPELALHYNTTHNYMPTPHQYSLFQSQTFINEDDNNNNNNNYSTPTLMVKQLMSTISNPRECETSTTGGSDVGLRYRANCTTEPGLEVGTCDLTATNQQMVVVDGRDHHDQGMNEWTMLDRLVTSHLGNNEDNSKSVRFEDHANEPSSVHQINQLSLRGSEMDFWGYEK